MNAGGDSVLTAHGEEYATALAEWVDKEAQRHSATAQWCTHSDHGDFVPLSWVIRTLRRAAKSILIHEISEVDINSLAFVEEGHPGNS